MTKETCPCGKPPVWFGVIIGGLCDACFVKWLEEKAPLPIGEPASYTWTPETHEVDKAVEEYSKGAKP